MNHKPQRRALFLLNCPFIYGCWCALALWQHNLTNQIIFGHWWALREIKDKGRLCTMDGNRLPRSETVNNTLLTSLGRHSKDFEETLRMAPDCRPSQNAPCGGKWQHYVNECVHCCFNKKEKILSERNALRFLYGLPLNDFITCHLTFKGN